MIFNQSNLKQSYDNHAEERDRSELQDWKLQEREQFLRRLQQEGCETFLEIGAGTGRDSLFFQQNGLHVTTVDLSEEMVRLCKEKGLADVHCMDFTYLDFEPGRFDAVYALNCLLHLPKAEIDLTLEQICKVLGPNGLFYYGVYGGQDSEGVWDQDDYEPKRFFSFYEDDAIQEMVKRYFILEDFHTVSIGEGKLHFQSMTLRKPVE